MSNNKDNGLNNIKIFGDLNNDVPVEAYGNTGTPLFPFFNTTLIAGLSQQGLASYLSQDLGVFAESGLGLALALIGLGASNQVIIQDGFTTDNLLTTKNGFISGHLAMGGAGNTVNSTLLRYDPFRQSIGSPWAFPDKEYVPDTGKFIDAKSVKRLKRADALGDPAMLSTFDLENYLVLNKYSPPPDNLNATEYKSAIANYRSPIFTKAPYGFGIRGVNYLGISPPTMISYHGGGVAKEEIIYVVFKSATGDSSSLLTANTNTSAEAVDKMKLLSLFFTIDQKNSGYSLSPATSTLLAGISTLPFSWGGDPENPTPVSEANTVGYDAVIDYNQVTETMLAPLDTGGGSVSEFTQEGEDGTGSGTTLLDDPNIVEYNEMLADISGIKKLCGEVFQSLKGKKYEDIAFNYSKAVNKEFTYLYGSELGFRPTANIQPFYNYLSPAYETVTTQTDISELALPNIYEIAEKNGYDFEAFGTEILNCANSEVGALNSNPNTKKKNNLVVSAMTFGATFGAAGIMQLNTAGILGHAQGISPDLYNSVESAKDDFPFGVEIEFTGDDNLYDGATGKSLSLTNLSKKSIPTGVGQVTSDIPTSYELSLVNNLFGSGIIYDFIKTLIYSHFAGDNLVDPPNMDPEKFALIASGPEFPNGAHIAKGIVDPKIQYFNEILEPSSVDLLPDSELIYNRSEDKTEYNFLRWLNIYNEDRSIQNDDSVLYKNNGDVHKVSQALGNESMKDIYNYFLSLTGVGNSEYGNFISQFLEKLIPYVPLDANGEPKYASIDPNTLLYRNYKECVSELSYSGHFFQGTIGNTLSIQQTIFYRIKKYNANNELIQNIFIPAHGAIVPDNKVPEPLYRYVDTQVKYGEAYSYDISAYKMVIGTEYEYDYAPYSTNPQVKQQVTKNKRFDRLASGLGFKGEAPNSFQLYTSGESNQMGQQAFFMPCYDKVTLVPNGDGGGGLTEIQSDDKLLMFAVKSIPKVKIIEVPYFKESFVAVQDLPPISPLVNVYPLVGKKNNLLISFENQTGDVEEIPIPIFPIDSQYFSLERLQQHRSLRGDDGFFIKPGLRFKSDDFPSAYESFRLTGTKPKSYADFANSEYRKVNVTEETSYVDDIQTNTKYYYVFRTVDIHGNISNPTPLYEIEMVEDSGAVYPLIRVVDFAKEENYVYSKDFRRYLKIDVSSMQSFLNEEKSGIDGTTAYNPDVQPVLGENSLSAASAGSVWNRNRPYKFRIKSKSTGRVIDLNVNFKLRHTDLIEPPTDCNDNLEPGGILTKDINKYLGSDGEGDL